LEPIADARGERFWIAAPNGFHSLEKSFPGEVEEIQNVAAQTQKIPAITLTRTRQRDRDRALDSTRARRHSTILSRRRFGRAKIKIHSTDIHDCEIPREIFLTKETGSHKFGDVSHGDFGVVDY
jgi:hypothetical protein